MTFALLFGDVVELAIAMPMGLRSLCSYPKTVCNTTTLGTYSFKKGITR